MVAPLIDGFQHFRKDFFVEDKSFFDGLVTDGQKPKTMVRLATRCVQFNSSPVFLSKK